MSFWSSESDLQPIYIVICKISYSTMLWQYLIVYCTEWENKNEPEPTLIHVTLSYAYLECGCIYMCQQQQKILSIEGTSKKLDSLLSCDKFVFIALMLFIFPINYVAHERWSEHPCCCIFCFFHWNNILQYHFHDTPAYILQLLCLKSDINQLISEILTKLHKGIRNMYD